MDGRRWFTRARGGGHRYLSQSCNAKQQPAANHTGCHADIHGYPVIRPGFPTVPGVQGVPIISFLDTLWNGWLIERLVCGNNGCFVSERERRSNRLNPACACLLFAPASAAQRKDRTAMQKRLNHLLLRLFVIVIDVYKPLFTVCEYHTVDI